MTLLENSIDNQADTEQVMLDLYNALSAVMPWAGKAVAEHPYNQKIGGRAIDKGNAALSRYESRRKPEPDPLQPFRDGL